MTVLKHVIVQCQVNQDHVENLFSIIRSMGGSHTHPNPLEFATRIRVVKVTSNIDALVPDGANVKLTRDDNTESVTEDPSFEAELGSYDN